MPHNSIRFAFCILLFPAIVRCQPVSFRFPSLAFESGASITNSLCNTCIVTADFNGDGNADIAYAFGEFSRFEGVLLGNGDGTFRDGGLHAGESDGRPLTGDFDGDGRQDLVISGLQTWFYRGHGDGNFDSPVEVPNCQNSTQLRGVVVAADWNGDGRTDLACPSGILLGSIDGAFRAAGGLSGFPVLSADFNNDQKLDLLVAGRTDNALSVNLGNGDGTFSPGIPVVASLDSAWTITYTALAERPPVLAGDFNGDGMIDLATLSKAGGAILVFPGRGNGSFGTPVITQHSPGPLLAVADFNNDGRSDLVAGNAILAGNGDGTFRFPVFFGAAFSVCGAAAVPSQPNVRPCSATFITAVVADFNGGGLPDLVTGSLVAGTQHRYNVDINILQNNSPGDGLTSTGISAATLEWPVGPGSFVSILGDRLASTTTVASADSPPTVLGGVRIHARIRGETEETLARLLYVSPTQINFLLPLAEEFVWIGLERIGTSFEPSAMGAPVRLLAPGFFTVSGLAAGTTIRVEASGAQMIEPATSCPAIFCRSNPIDLSGGRVYLSLYGTGFAEGAMTTTCSIAGRTLPVAYAGPQWGIAGLDQLNVLLPPSLSGAGFVPVVCAFESFGLMVTSNDAWITIR